MKRLLCSLAVLFALALPAHAQATTLTITGTITDGTVTVPFSATATIDAVAITSVTVTPAIAAAGTLRTLKVVATSSANLPLTAPLPTAQGITFTALTGQPPGTFAWTFTF